ncbi:cyclic AMP receptor 3-like [Corticium candelabrum]|uniref:cyclic AMP receptor 3-like n=1 Tax=Corticium candelabrum TaxID=121492 RepID=UPI002E26459D|nr:cyclic AMP receptor 3-like [Corticium candelabrum]
MDNSTNSTCDEWPDNPGYCVAIEVGRTLTAVLSLLGCLFMILIIWLFRKYQFFVQRLILWLTIAAFLDAVGYVIATDQVEKNTLCIFQAFWITLFDWTVLLWVTCLTFNLFLIVLKLKKTDHLEWIYHLISWAGSLIIACIPFSNGIVYGPANTLCWIKAGANAFRFAIWYVPLVILLILMVSAYLYIVFIINRRSKTWSGSYDPEMERKMTLLKSDIKSLRFYPLVFLVLNVFPLINR